MLSQSRQIHPSLHGASSELFEHYNTRVFATNIKNIPHKKRTKQGQDSATMASGAQSFYELYRRSRYLMSNSAVAEGRRPNMG